MKKDRRKGEGEWGVCSSIAKINENFNVILFKMLIEFAFSQSLGIYARRVAFTSIDSNRYFLLSAKMIRAAIFIE